MELTVKAIDRGNTFGDKVRIPQKYRGGVKEGRLCKLSTNIASKIVQVYGKRGEDEPNVYMDKRTRDHFGLSLDGVANFELVPVGWIGQIGWAAGHADPTVRIAAQLGVISVALGLLAAVIALFPVVASLITLVAVFH